MFFFFFVFFCCLVLETVESNNKYSININDVSWTDACISFFKYFCSRLFMTILLGQKNKMFPLQNVTSRMFLLEMSASPLQDSQPRRAANSNEKVQYMMRSVEVCVRTEHDRMETKCNTLLSTKSF